MATSDPRVRRKNLRDHLSWVELGLGSEAGAGPRPHEDGRVIVGPCDEYRPILHVPGYCWCGCGSWDHE